MDYKLIQIQIQDFVLARDSICMKTKLFANTITMSIYCKWTSRLATIRSQKNQTNHIRILWLNIVQ